MNRKIRNLDNLVKKDIHFVWKKGVLITKRKDVQDVIRGKTNMPYIKKDERRDALIIKGAIAQNAGELNYQMFYVVKHFYHQLTDKTIKYMVKVLVADFLGNTPNYQKYNDMTGALIRCYKELNRRLNIDVEDMFLSIMESYDEEINAYEDTKIISNGDVDSL